MAYTLANMVVSCALPLSKTLIPSVVQDLLL